MENKTIERNSSISISKNSKNSYTWDIKIYFDTDETQYATVLEKIDEIDKQLRITYGF